MDTQAAIAILQTESQNISATIDKNTNLKVAIDLAIAQLQGILNTPSADLVEAQAQIAELTSDPVTPS